MTTQPNLLVTGASGHLGQRVLHHLLDTLNIAPDRIIATSRNTQGLAAFAARGVTTRVADFSDAAALPAAFAGADRLLLISTTSFEDRFTQHKSAISAAIEAGVKHVIYTSIPNPADPTLAIVRDHAATEVALAASSLPGWTVLRNNWYFENLNWTIPSMLKSGKWFTASGDGRIAYVSRDDLAYAAAAALANGGDAKSTLTLSGAKAYTTAELAELISAASGKPLAAVQISPADLERGMVGSGMPAPMAAVMTSAEINIAAGRLADVTGDVKALTGVEPLSFEDWLASTMPALLKAAA